MLELKGFSAWIEVDKVAAQEYNIEISEDGKQVTCWIASEVDKHFSIHWRDSIRETSICGRVFVDGLSVAGRVGVRGSRDTWSLDGVLTLSTCKPFVFSPLQLTDDDSYLNSANGKDVGQIHLRIWRIADRVTDITPPVTTVVMDEEKIHERSKKGIAHRAQLGKEEQLPTPTIFNSVIELDNSPIITFLFKYRPLEFLRAAGIAPSRIPEKRRAPTSPEPEVKPDDEGGNEEDPDLREAKLLEERLKAVQAKLAKKGKKFKKIKTETRPVFVSGEVIDLT